MDGNVRDLVDNSGTIDGGAVALGHPIGCSGARILTTLIYALRDRGLPLPSCAICISPWTDLSCESPSIRDNERRDPMIPAPGEFAWE